MHPLRSFRTSQNPPLTQGQLADLIGVSRVAVNRWESGRRKIEPEKLPLVSQATGIPARELRPDLAEMLEAAE